MTDKTRHSETERVQDNEKKASDTLRPETHELEGTGNIKDRETEIRAREAAEGEVEPAKPALKPGLVTPTDPTAPLATGASGAFGAGGPEGFGTGS